MSDNQNFTTISDRDNLVKLHICLFSKDKYLVDLIQKALNQNTYNLTVIAYQDALLELVQNQREKIDCLLIANETASRNLVSQLQHLDIVIPTAIIYQEKELLEEEIIIYHLAEVKFKLTSSESKVPNLEKTKTAVTSSISNQINLALAKFLHLSPHAPIKEYLAPQPKNQAETTHNLLALQQRRLAEKLKERLGDLGVFYQRSTQDFYRNLPKSQQNKLSEQLAKDYRKIIISYFEDESNINQAIDRFVNQAFFADISVSQVIEIHMKLMDEFAQQLKLEGRSEDILLDYRLALIDIIAHLCEMYRRCIPKEDISLDVLYKID
jgi:circadian clock protein KaiA